MISDKATTCPHCGAPVAKEVFCSSCGKKIKSTDTVCPYCGAQNAAHHETAGEFIDRTFAPGRSGKSRVAAALFAIFLGCFGVHFFYVGKTGAGILNLAVSVLGSFLVVGPVAVEIISIIQGILMLTMTQEEFERRYVDSTNFYPF